MSKSRPKPQPDVTAVPTGKSVSVTAAIESRRSIREFTDQQVPLPLLKQIIDRSSRAASGGNIQPWKVYVLAGDARQRVCDAVLAKIQSEQIVQEADLEYDIYPLDMRDWEGEQVWL